MTTILANLSSPLDPAKVSWRLGSTSEANMRGMALAYIDARDVMERLDAVVGAAGWQDRYEFHGPRTICYLSIKIGDEWVTKADGAGDSDVEAEKGAISDAFKRAAVKWGIGRYLYDLESPWVEIEKKGRSYIIAKKEYARLVRALPGSTIKAEPQQQEPVQGNAGTPFDGDAATDRRIIDTLLAAMQMSKSVIELRRWYKGQLPEINQLSPEQQDEFNAAAKAYQDTLTQSEAA